MIRRPPRSTLFPYTSSSDLYGPRRLIARHWPWRFDLIGLLADNRVQDRKSTRLNSSHMSISYAVFCLKKKTPHHIPRVYALLLSTRHREPAPFRALSSVVLL